MKKSGFTLVELLVVISIIGVLASVVFASINSARAKARDARRIADLRQIATALEFYYDANGQYPPDVRSPVTLRRDQAKTPHHHVRLEVIPRLVQGIFGLREDFVLSPRHLFQPLLRILATSVLIFIYMIRCKPEHILA